MSNETTPFEALSAAVLRAGSQSALARICKVSQTAVWKWLQSGKKLPAEHVLAVEAETGVSKHLLRPDIYPPSEAASWVEPCEDCGPALTPPRTIVAGNHQAAFPRKDVA